MDIKSNKVYITAYSSISALGTGNLETLNNMSHESQPIFFPDKNEKIIKPYFKINNPIENTDKTRCSQIALKLLTLIEKEWLSINPITIFISTSTGGIKETEENYKELINKTSNYPLFKRHFFNIISDDIKLKYEDRTTNTFTMSTACSSSGHSIMQAYNFIKSGIINKALVLGVDSLSYTTMIGFDSLKLVSEKGTKPLTLNRDGLSLGEGGGVLLLESDPGCEPMAEILSCSTNTDGYHISSPDPEGKEQKKCINKCIKDAEIDINSIDYINAHGTGTLLNDKTEIDVISSIFPKTVTVTSTKSFIGHTLGASAVTEIAIILEMLKTGKIFQPENFNESMDKDYIPEKTIKKKIKYFLKNSFGFGGNNVSLIIKNLL